MSGARIAKWIMLAAAGALIVYGVWKWPEWRAEGRAGSAYAARITCSCRFVEGRDANSCREDIAEDASLVSVTDDPDAKRVVARVPLLGRASARFKPGYGCLMEQP